MGVAFNGAHHAHVSEAATEDMGQGLLNLSAGGVGIMVEKGLGSKDDAAEAKAALRRLFLNEGLLDGMRLLWRTQAFQGHNFGCADGAEWSNAGTSCLTIHEDGAGAALTQAAAEFGAAQLEFVA
jgi:hypothetical protein